MNLNAQYASKDDLANLSKQFSSVLTAIPYYNEQAKKSEHERYSASELHAKLDDDPHSIIIIKNEGDIVAFCFSRFDDYTIWLEWFGIMPDYRGLGVSTILLEKLEEASRVRKAHKIWCDTRTENKQSVKILMLHGYEKITEIKNHWYGQDFLLWQKFL